MGMFIVIEIDNSKLSQDHAGNLKTMCPVDIFLEQDGSLDVDQEQEDECILCELCIDLAPNGAIEIHKTYSDKKLVSRASN